MRKENKQFKEFSGQEMTSALWKFALANQHQARLGKYLGGIIHNLNGALQNTQIQFELLQLVLQAGESSLESPAVKGRLRQLGEELDRLAEMLNFWGEQADFEGLADMQRVDLRQAIDDALTFMQANPRFKHQISVHLDLPQLPHIMANRLLVVHTLTALLEAVLARLPQQGGCCLPLRAAVGEDSVQIIVECNGDDSPESWPSSGYQGGDAAGEQNHMGQIPGHHLDLNLHLADRAIAPFGGSIRCRTVGGKTRYTVCFAIPSQ
ncbi:MAG: hypothetical protein JRJ12_03065 [Deltaproteobacteria bacterium]|nr:hypothetical protein [Deltaproteobacteria bacterium]MBW2071776.1 hypothetical protein [Deltaproteobacteria bacterium]